MMCEKHMENGALVQMMVSHLGPFPLGTIESGWELSDLFREQAQGFAKSTEKLAGLSQLTMATSLVPLPVMIRVDEGPFYTIGFIRCVGDFSYLFQKAADMIDRDNYEKLGIPIP